MGILLNIFKKHPFVTTTFSAGLLICGSAMAALSVTPENPQKIAAMVSQIQTELPLGDMLQEQSNILDQYKFVLFRNGYTQTSDTPQTLFERLDIEDPQALDFVRKDTIARMILGANRSVRVAAEIAPDGSLIRFRGYLRSHTEKHFQRITIERDATGALSSMTETVPAQVNTRIAMGTIKYSLYGATNKIGLPNNISYQLADIFDSRIDFTRQLRQGDSFQLVYESYEADGEPLGTGRILAAQFVNAGKHYNAVWFKPDENVRGNYYTFDGKSLRTTFLAYPLEYTRISSQFGRRLHPILNTWRNHNGTDYAAPMGTPIRTVGDGRVTFAGVQRGYGNVVIVSHDKARTTLYAHMSRIDVSTGQMLEQGDIIGAVGQTGWATGPHLHLEFHENGVRKDPAILATQTEAQPIPEEFQAIFDQKSHRSSDLIVRMENLMLTAQAD